jgi:hypothetical protein
MHLWKQGYSTGGLVHHLAIDRILNPRVAEIGGNQDELRCEAFPIRKVSLVRVEHESRGTNRTHLEIRQMY